MVLICEKHKIYFDGKGCLNRKNCGIKWKIPERW